MVLDCLRSSICPEIIEIDATLVSFLPWGRATGFNGGTLRESTSTPLSFIWSSPQVQRTRLSAARGGALGYFLGGYVPPETPNWHPVLKTISPKIDTPF